MINRSSEGGLGYWGNEMRRNHRCSLVDGISYHRLHVRSSHKWRSYCYTLVCTQSMTLCSMFWSLWFGGGGCGGGGRGVFIRFPTFPILILGDIVLHIAYCFGHLQTCYCTCQACQRDNLWCYRLYSILSSYRVLVMIVHEYLKVREKFQRCPLKFHTKFSTHTPQNMHFTRF